MMVIQNTVLEAMGRRSHNTVDDIHDVIDGMGISIDRKQIVSALQRLKRDNLVFHSGHRWSLAKAQNGNGQAQRREVRASD